MNRVVLFTMTMLILLLIDVAGVYVAATGRSVLVAILLCIPGVVLVWAILGVRFDVRPPRPRRWPHRGATRVGYNPWLGGGIDEDR
jgi:hypothetical protein